MEITYPNQVINMKYKEAMDELKECINIEFEKVKRNHKEFHFFITHPNINNVCKTQREDLINLIDEGILDYGQFDKK